MDKSFNLWVFRSCGLLVLGLALFAAPASHALAAPHFPASGGGGRSCVLEYGVSSDADTFSTTYNSALGGELPFFSFGAFEPLIGAVACANPADFEHQSEVDVYFVGFAGWYNIQTTVAGTTTQTTLDDSSVDEYFNNSYPNPTLWGVHYTAMWDGSAGDLPLLQVRQPFSVQVQQCENSSQGPSCSPWSPHVQFTVYANNGCVSGYVPRLTNPYDQVCVTPAEQAQVAFDNSQIMNRLDTGTVSGELRCLRGYVWRHAFGGDQACVTLAQRNQVVQDNSLAASRIIAQ